MLPNSIIYIIALINGYKIVGVFSRAPLFPRSPYGYPWGFSQGEPAKPGEIPYQVQILNFGKHRCAGSLTLVNGTQVVITAANCVVEDVPGLTVVAGEIGNSEMPRSSRSGQRRQVANIAYHQDYRSWNSLSNDIAILGLDKPFEMNENVQPIALPEMGGGPTDGELMISGWKGGYRGAFDSEVLQKVVVPIIPGFECQESYEGEEEFFTASTICAGTYGKGPCLATSGSPMRSLKYDFLAGIVSYGYGCNEGKYIGTNVAHFVDWIQDKVAHF